MKVLFDIVHPADVLFFYHPIKKLMALGHSVVIASRTKDVTCDLLDAFELPHENLSTASSGVIGLATELILRDIAMFKLAKKEKPDVMIGFGGVSISHIGKLLKIPSISFYDTEKANLQHMVTLPFITEMYVPESYNGKVAKNRTTTFAGLKDFSYLHPENFKKDKTLALAAGYNEDKHNYFIRLVNWNANHDLGLDGWNIASLTELITKLSESGQVHISSESELPEHLKKYQYQGKTHHIHHLLAHCNAYIGESATMAGEAVLLGVPAIYAANDQRGYTDDLAEKGLLWNVTDVVNDNIFAALKDIENTSTEILSDRLTRFVSGKENIADLVVKTAIKYG